MIDFGYLRPLCTIRHLLVAIVFLISASNSIAEWTVKEIRVEGALKGTLERVMVTRHGQSAHEEVIRSASPATVLESNTLLTTPANSLVILSSPSGTQEIRGATSVRLSGGSKGEIFEILAGAIAFEVAKRLDFFYVKHDAGKNRSFVAGVQGTKFAVDVQTGNRISFDVQQGEIWVARPGLIRIDDAPVFGNVATASSHEVIPAGTKIGYRLDAEEYLFSQKTFAGAIEVFNKQLLLLRQDKKTDPLRLLSTLRSLGDLHVAQGASRAALPYFEDALKIAEDPSNKSRIESYWQADLQNRIGMANARIWNFKVAIEHYQQSLDLFNKIPEAASELTAIHINIGQAYGGMGLQECALVRVDKAVRSRIDKFAYPEIYSLIGNSLNSKGALQCFRRELNNQKQLSYSHQKGDPELAQAHINLGFALVDRGKAEEAESEFRAVKDILEELFPGASHPLLADSEQGAARVAAIRGRFAKAIEKHNSALSILNGAPPDETTLRIAVITRDLGDIYGGLKRFEEAVDAYKKALEQWRLVYPDEVHPDIAATYVKLAEIWKQLHQPKLERDSREKFVAIMKSVREMTTQCLGVELGDQRVNLEELKRMLRSKCD